MKLILKLTALDALRYQSLLNIFCARVSLYSYPTLVWSYCYGMSCVLFRVKFVCLSGLFLYCCSISMIVACLCQVHDVSIENSMQVYTAIEHCYYMLSYVLRMSTWCDGIYSVLLLLLHLCSNSFPLYVYQLQ